MVMLQEALEWHRPEFVSRSRERMKRLCLLVEERKMQAIFNKEREELFNPSSTMQQLKAGWFHRLVQQKDLKKHWIFLINILT